MIIDYELLQKINNGDGLTDEELNTAIKFFVGLHESLGCLGKEFYLATREVHRTLNVLQSYLFYRKAKNSA